MDIITENTPITTVSLVTVTQYARMECLTNLRELITAQLYPNIIEWVIVEGSQTKIDAFVNEQHIDALKKTASFRFPIIYVPFKEGQKLSDLRNAGNATCKGDIIVCMDDDDYYPPTRVGHAVYKLINSSALIAGCSKCYLYFYDSKQLYQFRSLGQNHSTNNCMAYKREYLKNNAHASGLSFAEESSFTNNFSEPMVQLTPEKCIVISGHLTNTVDKRWIKQPGYTALMINEIKEKDAILELIPTAVFLDMRKLFLLQ